VEAERDHVKEMPKEVAKAVKAKKAPKYIPWILRPGNYALVFVQEKFNWVFTPQLNPLYFLGSITFLLFWVALASGIYLFLFYEITPEKAYSSVQYMTEGQKYYGGIIRSLHRYSSDGLMIVIIVHMIQVFFSDRFRKYRWVAWVTGAAIIPVIWFEGVTGYFLPWDEVAQMTSIAMSQIISTLPISAEPMERLFAHNDAVTPLLFFIMTYLHLAVPCLLLILAWVHCMRISMPLITPPPQITYTILAALLVLSLVKPAVSAGPADLGSLVGEVNIDWFYLGVFVVFDYLDLAGGHALFWGGVVYTGFILLPWVIRDPKRHEDSIATVPQVDVRVDLEKCKGCPLCQQSCPFEAMILVNRKDGKNYDTQAEVIPAHCSQCGFCVNACEFGAVSMGGWNKGTFHDFVTKVFTPAPDGNGESIPTSIAFICERSFNLEGFLTDDCMRVATTPDVGVMVIPCIGAVSPSLVEHCFEVGAKGVMVIGCRGLDCHYREERRRVHISKEDGSHKFMVESIDDNRLRIMLVSPLQIEKIRQEIDEFNEEVKQGVAS